MPEELKNMILQLANLEESETLTIKITALYNSILSYLNRDTISNDLFPVVSLVIVECLEQGQNAGCNVQSLKEGDMSITYSVNSPFFGKLDSYKLIRGIN